MIHTTMQVLMYSQGHIFDFNKNNNIEDVKVEVGDHVRISKY